MATLDLESPRIQVLAHSVRDREERRQARGEQKPLLGTNNRRHRASLCSTRCCIKSKSALLILCWEILITLTYGYVVEFGLAAATSIPYLSADHMYKHEGGQLQIYATSFFALLAILYLFYPLAGCLADIRCGRYKTVIYSLWIMTGSGVIVCIGFIVVLIYTKMESKLMYIGPPIVVGILLLLSSSIVFNANVIQFGMDQLHDSPAEDSVLFIYWFVFTSHLGTAVNKFIIPGVIGFNPYLSKTWSIVIWNAIPMLAIFLLGISLVIAHHKRLWFMIDSGSRNPYKLVYKVIKFTAQHKSPIRRSAFTYCEDELPSRMDLAKEKYGGPFTTEQVEDVKAFLGILQVLFTFGSIFMTDIAASNVLYRFSNHLSLTDLSWDQIYKRWYLIALYGDFLIGGLPKTLTVILLPIYLCVLQPFIHHYIPGMLKCIGLGIIIRLLSLLILFLIDTIGHIYDRTNNICFIRAYYSEPLTISMWFVIVPYTLNALSDMLFYIAAYEFICAQSPHSMKGLLIGTFFAVKGVFQLIGVMIILVPFTTWKYKISFPSCGFVYYLVNIVVAVIGLVAYTWVARSYQYRQRDEPDNIYRYAEEYYDRDRDQLDSTYDYSNDHDDLNIHTVS